MKPLHVGLLVVGAALAGGLAVKMTQPQAWQVTQVKPGPPSPPVVAEEISTASSATYKSDSPTTAAPPPIYKEEQANPKPAAPRASSPKPVTPKAVPAPVQIARATEPPPATPAQKPSPIPYQPTPEPTPPQQLAPPPPVETARIPDPLPPSKPVQLQVTLQQGTQISVRLDQALASDHLSAGDTFQASLAEPLVVDGYIIAERGSRVSGRVVDSQKAGRLSGTSALGLSLSSIQTADGQKVPISTEPWVKQGNSSRNQDVAKIGGGAALGAIIGAIAGGGKGAAIGAGVGGVAGTGAAAATSGKPVIIASETVIRFRLTSRVKITERPL
jgi:hypothetical protein